MRSIGADGKIVFYRTDDARSKNTPFMIDPDGSNELELGDLLPEAVWSPDGSRLVFPEWIPDPSPQSGAPTEWIRPAVIDGNGSNFQLLNAYPDRQMNLAPKSWSADGSRVYVYSGSDAADPADVGLFSVRSADGGDLSRIAVGPGPSGADTVIWGFSRDQSALLVNAVQPRDGLPDLNTLFVARADGGQLSQISPDDADITVINLEFFDGVSEDWSPDGSLIAFCAAFTDVDQSGLFVVAPDGSGLRQIVPGETGAVSARFSPTGRQIAFTAEQGLDHNIWVVNSDGTGLTQLTNGADDWVSLVPVWSPDGSRLLFQRKHFAPGEMERFHQPADVTLWSMNADGTDQRQLSAVPLASDWVGPYVWWAAEGAG